jgi:hypothetical protein
MFLDILILHAKYQRRHAMLLQNLPMPTLVKVASHFGAIVSARPRLSTQWRATLNFAI